MDTDRDKKIAVTGSTGLVGSHLVAELLRGGCRSIVLPVRSRASLDKLYKTLEREKADHSPAAFDIRETALENTTELTEAFRGVETVFHCAAAVSLGGIDSAEIICTNVGITKSVVDAALGAGAAKLVFVSSIAALGGPREDTGYVDETSLMDSAEGATGYSASKFLSENEVRRGEAGGAESGHCQSCPRFGNRRR